MIVFENDDDDADILWAEHGLERWIRPWNAKKD